MSQLLRGYCCEYIALQGSVLEGVGRKLKGSDAARFRESVMRQTGFLEPQSMKHLPAD